MKVLYDHYKNPHILTGKNIKNFVDTFDTYNATLTLWFPVQVR